MESGIRLAAADSPEHAALLEVMLPQLLIVFLKRLGGSTTVPLTELDDTGQDLLAVWLDKKQVLHFELRKKT